MTYQLHLTETGWGVREKATMEKPQEYWSFYGIRYPRTNYRLEMDEYNNHLASLKTYSGSGLPPQGFKDGDEVVLDRDFKFQFQVTNFKGVAYSNTSNNQSTKVVALSLTKTEVKEEKEYVCSNCGVILEHNPSTCPNCGSGHFWPKTPPSREEEQGEVSKCCGSEMIPPDLEAAEGAGSLYSAFLCHICKKCGKPCAPSEQGEKELLPLPIIGVTQDDMWDMVEYSILTNPKGWVRWAKRKFILTKKDTPCLLKKTK